jgi:preprotein translocase subunit SecE
MAKNKGDESKTGKSEEWTAGFHGVGKRPRENLTNEHMRVLESLYSNSEKRYSGWVSPLNYEGAYDSNSMSHSSNNRNPSRTKEYQAVFKELENAGYLKSDNVKKDGVVSSRYALTTKGKDLIERIKESKLETRRISMPHHHGLVGATAIVFLLVGLISMIWQDRLTQTGNVVGVFGNTGGLDVPFVLSLFLMVIGGVLLFLSLVRK